MSNVMYHDPMQLPNVAVLHSDSIPESDFDELNMAVEGEGLRFHSESYEPGPSIESIEGPSIEGQVSHRPFSARSPITGLIEH